MTTKKISPWLIFISIILFGVLILVSISLFGVRRILDISQSAHDRVIPITAGRPVQLTIQPQNNNVSVIMLYLKNTNLANRDPFNFSLYSQGKLVRNISLNGTNILDGGDVRFQFPPIADSRGQIYQIVLSSPTLATSSAIHAGFSTPDNSLAYSVYYAPSGLASQFNSLIASIISRISPKLIISWLAIGLIGFLIAKKGIISL